MIEFLYTPHLASDNSMVYLPQLNNYHWLLTEHQVYADILTFYPVSFFSSKISCRIHTALIHWVFLFLMTLVVLRNAGQVLCRMSLNWDLSVFFFSEDYFGL